MCCHCTYSAKLPSVGQEEKILPGISVLLKMYYSFAFEYQWIFFFFVPTPALHYTLKH